MTPELMGEINDKRSPLKPIAALVARNAVVLVGYAALGIITLSVGQFAGLAAPLWPAAGLAFAAVYAWGWRLFPGILAGSIVANAVTLARGDNLTPAGLTVVLLVGVGAALAALAGAVMVTRSIGRNAGLADARSIITFLVLAGPVAALVSASIATAAQAGTGLLSADQAAITWLTWWAGDSIGVVVFAPLFLMLVPTQRPVWVGRRIRVALPALIAVAIFITLFFQVSSQEQQERSLRLDRLAASAANDLERNVAVQQEVLEGLATFFQSSEEVTAEEFRSFTQGALSRYPNLQAMSWNPLVTETDRQSFEEALRSEDGLVEFEITERNPEGELVAAEPRPEYVPVAFIEPLETNQAALGFDINSNPVRAEAIARARELGEPAATAPIELVQETGSQSGMLALVPVYESGVLSGFAVGVYRLGDLLTDTFIDSSWDDVEIRLYDISDDVEDELVAVRPSVDETSEDLTTAAESPVTSTPFDVYGRTWQVEVVPKSGSLATESREVSALIDVGGLIALFLLQAFVLLVTGLERTAARQAMEASQEARTDHLTGLLNRRAFLDQLERVCTRSKIEDEKSALLFVDLDGFKSVNDTAGHETGDRVLTLVAEALTTSVRSRDSVARLGGDEFAIILNNCDKQQARIIAENLEALVRAVEVDSVAGEMRVGVSIGVSEIGPEGAVGVDEVIRLADDACYAAKRAGGGVSVYEGEKRAATDG